MNKQRNMKGTMSENGFPKPTEECSLINNNKYPLNIVSDGFALYYSDFLQKTKKTFDTLKASAYISISFFFASCIM